MYRGQNGIFVSQCSQLEKEMIDKSRRLVQAYTARYAVPRLDCTPATSEGA